MPFTLAETMLFGVDYQVRQITIEVPVAVCLAAPLVSVTIRQYQSTSLCFSGHNATGTKKPREYLGLTGDLKLTT
jgi:hypothetical protein